MCVFSYRIRSAHHQRLARRLRLFGLPSVPWFHAIPVKLAKMSVPTRRASIRSAPEMAILMPFQSSPADQASKLQRLDTRAGGRPLPTSLACLGVGRATPDAQVFLEYGRDGRLFQSPKRWTSFCSTATLPSVTRVQTPRHQNKRRDEFRPREAGRDRRDHLASAVY